MQTTDRSEWAIFVGSIDSTVSRKLVASSYARFAAPNLLVYGTGKSLAKVGISTSSSRVRLSPDATRVALLEFVLSRPAVGSGSLWVAELGRNVKAPLASGPTTLIHSPTWSFDSARVLFGSVPEGERMTIVERVASGAMPATTLHAEAGYSVAPLDESRDGKLVVFSRGQAGRRSLHVLSKVDGSSTTYLESEFDHPQASLSPDGKWLAYVSNESGAYEVIVQTFPNPSLGKLDIAAHEVRALS